MSVKGPTLTPQAMPSGAPNFFRGVSDEFDAKELNRDRWTICNERPEQWSINDGWLAIEAQPGDAKAMQWNLRNLFLAGPPRGDFGATTRVKFAPSEDGESAFLTVWQDHNDFVRLSISQSGGRKIEVATERDAEHLVVKSIDNTLGDDVYLRIEKRGDRYSFLASADGKMWQTIAADVPVDLTDPSVALGAVSPRSSVDRAARFDFLRFESLESSSSAR